MAQYILGAFDLSPFVLHYQEENRSDFQLDLLVPQSLRHDFWLLFSIAGREGTIYPFFYNGIARKVFINGINDLGETFLITNRYPLQLLGSFASIPSLYRETWRQ